MPTVGDCSDHGELFGQRCAVGGPGNADCHAVDRQPFTTRFTATPVLTPGGAAVIARVLSRRLARPNTDVETEPEGEGQ